MDKTVPKINPTLARLAVNRGRAYEAWRGAFNAHMEALPELPAYDFWMGIEQLRLCVAQRGIGTRDGVQKGADEFMRRALCGEGLLSMDEALRFLRTYRLMKARLATALRKVSEKGDDGFGDLCDSLPLAGGRRVCEAAIAGDYGSERALFAAVRKAHGEKWATFADGENYVCMALDDTADKCYASCLARASRCETDNEEPHDPYATVESVETALDVLCEACEGAGLAEQASDAVREFRCFVATTALRDAEAQAARAQTALTAAQRENERAQHAVYVARSVLDRARRGR